MGKSIYIGTIFIALTLMIGSAFFPDSVPMWFASTSVGMNVARGVIVLAMFGLAITHPPRSMVFRFVLGIISAGFDVWALQHAFDGGVKFVDSLLLLESSIAFGIASLERDPLRVAEMAVKRSKAEIAQSVSAVLHRQLQIFWQN